MAKTDSMARALIEGILTENPVTVRVALDACEPGQLNRIREAAEELAETLRVELQRRPRYTVPI